MVAEFVVRLLDADDSLLSWVKVTASPSRQDGGRASCPLWVNGPTRFVIEKDGVPAKLSVHWLDLDIARVTPLMTEDPAKAGQVYTMNWIEPIWLVSGMRDVPLPAVTERRSVTISPPAAAIGARDPRVA